MAGRRPLLVIEPVLVVSIKRLELQPASKEPMDAKPVVTTARLVNLLLMNGPDPDIPTKPMSRIDVPDAAGRW